MRFLQLDGHFKGDGGTVRVAKNVVGAFWVDLLDYLAVMASQRLDIIRWSFRRALEAIDGMFDMGGEMSQCGANPLDGMDTKHGHSLCLFIELNNGFSWFEGVGVHSKPEENERIDLLEGCLA
jgi:hypothetical protein